MRFSFLRGGGISGGGLIPTFQWAITAIGERGGGMGLAADTRVRCQRGRGKKDVVVVIMGATGTGKSKLSIDVAERFSGEVVNADKIQVYRGLDVTTNKMPIPDRRGVPHHLLGALDPAAGELPAEGFRSLASDAVEAITTRGKIPVIAGGSNSYIHAMMVNGYDPRIDPFSGPPAGRHRLRYRSCLLWVDVEAAVLEKHLDRRVDEMVGLGMVEELEKYFARGEGDRHPGLGKAIGVPEFTEYFRRRTASAYEDAIMAIKENTRRLAEEQVRKIKRLGEMGWPLQRVDATATVAARLAGDGSAAQAAAWERDVLCPSLRAVERFLEDRLDASAATQVI
ncbi:adenylate isopentenyltransferase-like [Dendrobium catenatum]|uniref:Adenylate isopentenyltransferase 1, chloroplastic n=1 Tax=Dendrobium catenatum TaxID=906689 RepID=A0A2I0VES9_9ASPA|nr:adenylate isopentenyltransferase-like [Dendrobium catenatum]PKU61925.1 Adenylate isopentenyltransferase 1, chloroplastic [Dendrobium catenatum]